MGNCCKKKAADPETDPTDWVMATPALTPKERMIAEYLGSGSTGSENLDGGRVLPTRNRSRQVDLTIGNLSKTEASVDVFATTPKSSDAATQPSRPSLPSRSPPPTLNTLPCPPARPSAIPKRLSTATDSIPKRRSTTTDTGDTDGTTNTNN